MKLKAYIPEVKQFLLYMVAFMLACDIYATPILIVLYTLTWIAEGNLKEKLSVALNNRFVWLFCSFYLLHLLGMAYTSNLNDGWFNLQTKLSLFIFPIILSTEGKMNLRKLKAFTLAFTAGLVFNGLICLGKAIWRWYALNLFIFQYKEFSLFLHPSYYSMYIDMAFVLLFHLLGNKDEILIKGEKAFIFVSLFFLEFILVLLQSKAGLGVSVLVIAAVLLRYVILQKRWKDVMLVLALGTGIYYVTNRYIITSGRSRVISAEEVLESQKRDSTTTESTQVRLLIWPAALEVIKGHPVLGVGTGDARNELIKVYSEKGMKGAAKERLNAHDEYLQCAITLGGIGFVVMLACFFIPIIKSIKDRRYAYLLFLIMLLLNFLPEAMLETQGGTMFYGLFNSLLMFNFVI